MVIKGSGINLSAAAAGLSRSLLFPVMCKSALVLLSSMLGIHGSTGVWMGHPQHCPTVHPCRTPTAELNPAAVRLNIDSRQTETHAPGITQTSLLLSLDV